MIYKGYKVIKVIWTSAEQLKIAITINITITYNYFLEAAN